MQVNVYQINPDRDKNRVRYERLDDLPKYQGRSKVDESLYDRVLRADVDCENLEQLYTLINSKGHPLHHGGQMKVSDVIVTDDQVVGGAMVTLSRPLASTFRMDTSFILSKPTSRASYSSPI